MFECGFEGTSLKVTKHSHIDKAENNNDDKMTNKTDSDTCYADSLRSYDEYKNDKSFKMPKTSVIDEIFKKKDSTSSKPSTPNLGCANTETHHQETEIMHDINVRQSNKNIEKASTCVIELKSVWFNFAAPPRTPMTKKIDFTR